MPNDRVLCKNLAPWNVSFLRKNTPGDVVITENAKMYIEEQEVRAQVFSNNKLFIGTDGKGAHAQIYIEDDALRREFGFESEDGKQTQELLTDEKLKKLFDYKREADFEKGVRDAVKVHYEAFRLVEYIKQNAVNDHKKIRFVEGFAGVRIE